jgi:hypothetical protein
MTHTQNTVGRGVSDVPHKRGSIIMEFMLVMPILLLLFGATMLWMDISLGKMYIQEANRNLAWLTEDRYDDGKIKAALYDSAREPYELRNKVEKSFGGTGDMWKYSGGTTNVWGRLISDFASGKQKLDMGSKCKWNEMASGNMDLKMAHLSGVYMGAVALGSVLHPDGETKHLYAEAYDFTRSRSGGGTNDAVALDKNLESVVIHRAIGNDIREKINTPNDLVSFPLPLGGLLYESWPTDGTSLQEVMEEIIDPEVGVGEDPVRDFFLGRRQLW